jgi:hypothetical protein
MLVLYAFALRNPENDEEYFKVQNSAGKTTAGACLELAGFG